MIEKNLDFRSDTVTKPSPEMREAMYKAKVGDDVYGDDPSINELERVSAEIFGMEAGKIGVTLPKEGMKSVIMR